MLTTQEYLLGLITPERPSPVHTLVSSGVEAGIELAHRAVIAEAADTGTCAETCGSA